MKIFGKEVHPKITEEAIIEACERRMTTLDNPGFCLHCGIEAEGIDTDARAYKCEACGYDAVFGSDELAMEIA